MSRWTEAEVLINVVEMGSLTGAAEAMGQSVSSISRHLVSLEERLGVRLVQRTTRSLSVTEQGEAYYNRVKELHVEMSELDASVSRSSSDPSGKLSITASTSFSLSHLMPIIGTFVENHSRIQVELTANNRYYDLIENGIDLAVRTRRVEADSTLTIRRLAETRRRLVASPSYLQSHGLPSEPEDLLDHRVLIYLLADDPLRFHFVRGEEKRSVTIKPTITSNEGQLLLRAAREGLGIIAQPAYIVDDAIADGSLVRILDDWDLPRLTINLAFPTRRHLPVKTRLFIDYLVARFREKNYEQLWTS